MVDTLIRSSILERCILKMSTASVAVGTEDIDGVKRSFSTVIEKRKLVYFNIT